MAELKLPQSQALFALERNSLDVEKAIHAVYHEKIHTAQLYDYIWGDLEGGGIRQVQNEKVGEMIKQKQHEENVSFPLFRNYRLIFAFSIFIDFSWLNTRCHLLVIVKC